MMKHNNLDILAFHPNSEIQVINSKEYGASKFLLFVARKLRLDQIIFSRKNQWREDVLALLVGKLIYPFNEISLTNFHTDTVLWECCGHTVNKKPDVNLNCEQPLVKLLSRQTSIQKKLVEKHLEKRFAILYFLTSWSAPFEAEPLHAGLLTSAEGCPLGIEFFSDVEDGLQTQLENLVEKYELKSLEIVTDFPKTFEKTKVIKSLALSQVCDPVHAKSKLKEVLNEGFSHGNPRARAFLTILSLYLEWNTVQKFNTFFKKSDNKSWTFSAAIERLKSIRSQTVQIGNITVDNVKSDLDKEQSEIMMAFGLDLKTFFS